MIRPATTGGRPSKALANTIRPCRPRKRLMARAAPSGAPIAICDQAGRQAHANGQHHNADKLGIEVADEGKGRCHSQGEIVHPACLLDSPHPRKKFRGGYCEGFGFEVAWLGAMYCLVALENATGASLVSVATAFGLKSSTCVRPLKVRGAKRLKGASL
jgi:hypothetical protein